MNKNDMINEKFEEKYEKAKAKVDFNNMDFKGVKKFSKIISRICKILITPIIIASILILILSFVIVISYWNSIQDRIQIQERSSVSIWT